MSGISSSWQRTFDCALSVAAVGFVAFVLVFVHPASQADADVAAAATTQMRPRLAASK
jgi:hypothetical protein